MEDQPELIQKLADVKKLKRIDTYSFTKSARENSLDKIDAAEIKSTLAQRFGKALVGEYNLGNLVMQKMSSRTEIEAAV